ncbi:MAG: hypothetical protein IJV31_05930 [Clostridia bacterium]|nr:hypothetical protein [Bacilli bacterium]MBQ9658288.1 hypothetical protein [Clostridia bacterium]
MKTSFAINDIVYIVDGEFKAIFKIIISNILIYKNENDYYNIKLELLLSETYRYENNKRVTIINNRETSITTMSILITDLGLCYDNLEEAENELKCLNRKEINEYKSSIITVKELLEYPIYNICEDLKLTAYKEKCKQLLGLDIDV